jgi:hypothetical protein
MAYNDEFKIQVSIVKWLRLVMPQAVIQHSRNEHGKKGKAGMLAAQRQKAAGTMSGFPDLVCFPYAEVGPFFLEVKTPKGRVSDVQKQVHHMLAERGYPVGVVRSIDDVRAFLQDNGIGFNEVVF